MNEVLRRYGVWLLLLLCVLLFVFYGSGLDFDYVIPKRLLRLGAMGVAGICIAASALVFQTLTGNRILTPAVMGYEAVYLLLQAVLVLLLGTASLSLLGEHGNAALSVAVMLGYSWLIHRVLFRERQHNLYMLLLCGLVLTMVLGTFTQFIQLKTSPGEYAILQGFSYANFSHIQGEQLAVASLLLLPAAVYLARQLSVLDVLALGREQAMTLGVDYRRFVRRQLALVGLLVAISTSLVGPTAFMGVFVANISYALARNARHRSLLPLACGIAISMFVLGQLLVEQLFNYRTSISILINLVCGAYFLALMIRTRGAA